VRRICILGFLILSSVLAAQPAVEDFKKIFRLEIVETENPIIIDGKLDDPPNVFRKRISLFNHLNVMSIGTMTGLPLF